MLRKLICSLAAIMLLLSTISFSGKAPRVSAETQNGTNKVEGTLLLPDNPPTPAIGSDPSRYKEDVNLLMDLIISGGKDIGHTGWSAKMWMWSETPVPRDDGTESHWVDLLSNSTDNGYIDRNDYRAGDFTAEQLGVSTEVYNQMVQANTKINITVDSREDSERRIYRSYVVPSDEEVQVMLDRGETPIAFLYYNNDVKLNFTFKIPPDKPSGERTEIVYVPPTWGTGNVSWGMFKDTLKESGSSDTKIKWTNGLVAGSHYAQTASKYSMSGVATSTATTLNTKAGDKGKETYGLTYSYTDYRIDYYKCTGWSAITDEDGNITGWSCNGWQFTGSAPSWAHQQNYSCSVDLAVDHRYGETFEGEHGFKETMNIGRSASVSAKDCKKTENAPNTETITHESTPLELPTQTYMSFMEQPIKWEGKPMYNSANIFPYVKNNDGQGFAGVPELDDSFKKLNKYVEKNEAFDNPYAIPLRSEVQGTVMGVYSYDDFWVSRSTGYVTSSEHGKDLASVTEQTKDEYSLITGQKYRDEILDRSDLTSMYYLPIDANDNVMKPNTDYKMETQVNGLGYNNITIMHDQKYQFENYLLGSIFEEDVEDVADFEGVWIVEQNEIPFNDVVYSYSTTITPEQAMAISNATKGRTNFIFGHKGTDNMTVFDQVKTILNNSKFGEKLANTIPHLTDVDKADETL